MKFDGVQREGEGDMASALRIRRHRPLSAVRCLIPTEEFSGCGRGLSKFVATICLYCRGAPEGHAAPMQCDHELTPVLFLMLQTVPQVTSIYFHFAV
jgi:hypothetical protein